MNTNNLENIKNDFIINYLCKDDTDIKNMFIISLLNENKKLQEENIKLNEDIALSDQLNNKLEKSYNDLEKSNNILKDSNNQLFDELNKILSENSNLNEEINKLRNNINILNEEQIKLVTEKHNLLRKEKENNSVVDMVKKELESKIEIIKDTEPVKTQPKRRGRQPATK